MERNEGNEGGLGANAGQPNANEFSGSATPSGGSPSKRRSTRPETVWQT